MGMFVLNGLVLRVAPLLRVAARCGISLVSNPRVWCVCLLLVRVAPASAQTNEFRGLWADAWRSDLWTSQGISQVIADLRAGNFNALIPQVRRRGDALYSSNYEPKCQDVIAGFDPLADMLAKAHDTTRGQRIEVHPWLVTYHIWNDTNKLPPQPNHPLNLHRDWLMKDVSGNTLIDGAYTFDPGHPAVQQHTFNVAMDIVTRYDIDGLNFDYIRYSGTDEGYNDVTVARFQRLCRRAGKPSPEDPVWKQFRRDQITALLRKVYLNTMAIKPWVKISCDTITWAPAPTSDAAWYSSSAAWTSVLQDWRGWMQEGIMDLNIPMAYFRHSVSRYALDYNNWSNFTKDHRFNRQAAIGPGVYLNSISNSIVQIRQTRLATSSGKRADGVVGYSYGGTQTNAGLSRADFLRALVAPSVHDPLAPPVFAQPVETPAMPWKAAPTKGHLKGFVLAGTNILDGAGITLNGNVSRSATNDATGFYGFVDLEPGDYVVTASFAGFTPATSPVTIRAGKVATLDFDLPVIPPRFSSTTIGPDGTVKGQFSASPGNYGLDWTSNMANWFPLTNVSSASNRFEYEDRLPGDPRRFYRARRLP